MIFWIKFFSKGYFRFKTEKVNITIKFCIFHLYLLGTKFHFEQTILNCGTKFAQKGYFRSKNGNSEHDYWIVHIWISPSTKCQFKVTIFIFWTIFEQKGYFQFKTEILHFSMRPWSLLTILSFSTQEPTHKIAF